jgi:hypothetical protein
MNQNSLHKHRELCNQKLYNVFKVVFVSDRRFAKYSLAEFFYGIEIEVLE